MKNFPFRDMLLSMTGFGKATVELPSKKITVEIKSLNSKQLDLSLRCPLIYRGLEMELRNALSRRVLRGKVEATFSVESGVGESSTRFNIPLLKAYREQISAMAEALGIPEPADWYGVLLRFPDCMHSEGAEDMGEGESVAVMSALDAATDALMEYRRAEGVKLEEFFTVRINRIRELLGQVPKYEAERIEHIRCRISDGLAQVPGVEYDRSRLEQEMIFYIEKLDVNEEKQRLGQHLDYFMETMSQNYGQGKKLGFISQEMGREINTLGSKSNHAEMQRLVVRMKDELEQIKEQVLNVL